MPQPSKRQIPPEAGYPGLPIDDSPPQINQARAHQKENVLPRRERTETGSWSKLELGERGGDTAELFPVWSTTPYDLTGFGLGVAMYFQVLQILALVFFFCGLMQSQTINYYKSAAYSDGQASVPFLLRGSAICTRTGTVCLDAQCSQVDSVNLCQLHQMQAWFDLSMTILLLILIAIITVVQNNVSAAMDESVQTAQDYSVIVDDPQPSDGDTQVWADFFGQFGHVTFVTVAKDNGPLIKAMAQRRAIMREIIMMIGNGEESVEDDDDGILDTTWEGKEFQQKLDETDPVHDSKTKMRGLIMKAGAFGMSPMAKWKKALESANGKIQKALEEANFKPSKVFITFEAEEGQRACLKATSQGILTAAFDLGKDKINPDYVFKGLNVLNIQEAPEPSEIFWEDVDLTFQKRIKQQAQTLFITLLLVAFSVFCCKSLQTLVGTGGAAIWISLTNITIPLVLKYVCVTFEDHVSLDAQQMSLFLKLTFFRWMNTAVIIYLITDFDAFLSELAVKQVQAVILADAITTPIIRTLNIADTLNQLVICRYALTQEKMNSYFLGTPWMVAERYADMTKTLFLALFYSALFPAGLFMTCLGYGFSYTVDKYSLLRTWSTPAQIDDNITRVSRGHMTFAIYCHAMMTLIFYASFPFDNVCKDVDAGSLDWPEYRKAQSLYNVTSDEIHRPCDQRVGTKVFSILLGYPLTRNYMPPRQAQVVKLYAYLCAILSAVLFVAFFGKSIVLGTYRLFRASYSSDTKVKGQPFTSCDIEAYIPIIRHPALEFPLVAADVRTFQSKYLPFTLKEEKDYFVQSLYNKNELPGFSDAELNAYFSEVRYFEPPTDEYDEVVVDVVADEKEQLMKTEKQKRKV